MTTKKIQVYKVTDKDMKCRGFQFELGKRFEHTGNVTVCNSGFHSCLKASSCFNYYDWGKDNRLFICEVEIKGNEQFEGGNIDAFEKMCSDNITFIEEVTDRAQVLCNEGLNNAGNRNSGNRNSGDWNSGNRNSGNRNSGDGNSGNRNSGNRNSGNRNSGDWNSGDGNSGDRNSGDWNSGNRNSGDWNSGNRNSGNRNSGDRNSGDWNSGNRNSGDWNSGNRNSGNRNSGDGNSGDWNSGNRNSGDWNSGNRNSGDWNSGDFNTNTPKLRIFNQETDLKRHEIYYPSWATYIYLTSWVNFNDLSETQQKEISYAKDLGGALITKLYKQAWVDSFNACESLHEKKAVFDLPNFDTGFFLEITGIDLRPFTKKTLTKGFKAEVVEFKDPRS